MTHAATLLATIIFIQGVSILSSSAGTLDETPRRDVLEQKIMKERQTIEKYHRGYIIIGKVELDGPGDPRDVKAQMEILEDGYFASHVKDLDRPIGFRLHGYEPLDVSMPSKFDDIIDLGTIVLKKLPPEDFASLKGRLKLQRGKKYEDATVKLTIRVDPINTVNGGFAPRSRRSEAITAEISDDGTISATGFSPAKYYCSISAPGHDDQSEVISFSSGKEHNLGTIRLEASHQIYLSYIVADSPEFDIARKEEVTLWSGDRWKATPDIYGWDLKFEQVEGEVQFDSSYFPCFIKDLGKGNLEDFIKKATKKQPEKDPRGETVKSGHVYLLDHQMWKHWVLFRVEIE